MRPFLYAIGILLGIGFCFFGVLTVLGMGSWFPGVAYINVSPSKLAEWAVETGRSPRECSKLHFIDPFPRPTIGELRRSCVFDYAQAAKDPLVCKGLLPTEYALACITNLLPRKVDITGVLRSCNYSKDFTFCFSPGRDGEPDIILRYDSCNEYRDEERRDTCFFGKSINESYSCDFIKNDSKKNHCIYVVALLSRDATKCEAITNERKNICFEFVDILIKYPNLRSSSYLTW